MEELATGGFVGKFGLDLRLFFAQVVNILIVLLVLSRFVFRPLLKTMRERSQQIAQGLQDAETMKAQKEEVRRWEAEERQRIRRDVATMLARAETEARTRRDDLLRHAETEAQAMHDRAVTDAARLHEDALLQAQQDVGVLVIDVAERVLEKKMTNAEKSAYLRHTLLEVEHRGEKRR